MLKKDVGWLWNSFTVCGNSQCSTGNVTKKGPRLTFIFDLVIVCFIVFIVWLMLFSVTITFVWLRCLINVLPSSKDRSYLPIKCYLFFSMDVENTQHILYVCIEGVMGLTYNSCNSQLDAEQHRMTTNIIEAPAKTSIDISLRGEPKRFRFCSISKLKCRFVRACHVGRWLWTRAWGGTAETTLLEHCSYIWQLSPLSSKG
jgi:hypothetical protein